MSPTGRVGGAVAVLALLALALPIAVVALAGVAVLTAFVVDGWRARRRPTIERQLSAVLARGVPAALRVDVEPPAGVRVRVRQAVPPDLAVDPAEADGGLDARVLPLRRGRHALPGAAVRAVGPLGLGRWDHRRQEDQEVVVYPDLPAARRLALAVREGRFRVEGQMRRGPLGLGTEFESVREYSPDDDIRQVNWLATARLGRPMSNQYRLEQDRDVLCLVDCGRLMASPIGDRTRLDAALDAVVAVALVADEVGDRCGAVAFDAAVRRQVQPRRRGSGAVVEALFDLEPATVDSDYELAFQVAGRAKRAFVLLLTDLVEEVAARPLLDAVPLLARRHSVTVASAADPEVDALVRTAPADSLDAYAAAVAVDALDRREAVALHLERAGARVLEATPDALASACVRAYLTSKRRARL